MELRPLYFLGYFSALAFVMAWLARLGIGFFHWSRKAGLYRLMAGQRKSLKPFRDNLPWNHLLLSISGFLFGWTAITWSEAWFVREWLLFVLPALAFLLLELRLTKNDISFLSVYALTAGLYNEREAGQDFVDRLIKVVDGLPPGEIQAACRESIQRRRSGLSVERSCQALYRLNPFLGELVFTLRLTGWQANPSFDLALECLAKRAGRKWDRISRWMVFQGQIQPLLQFSLAAILAALLYLVVGDMPAFALAWPSYEVIAWIGLGCILAAGVLYTAHQHAWLRRLTGSALLFASFVLAWQYASLPRLFELQLQSTTYTSERILTKKAVWQTVPARTASSIHFETLQENQVPGSTPLILPTITQVVQSTEDFRSRSTSATLLEYVGDPVWKISCCRPR